MGPWSVRLSVRSWKLNVGQSWDGWPKIYSLDFHRASVHKEGLCPSCGDINRLLMMMIKSIIARQVVKAVKFRQFISNFILNFKRKNELDWGHSSDVYVDVMLTVPLHTQENTLFAVYFLIEVFLLCNLKLQFVAKNIIWKKRVWVIWTQITPVAIYQHHKATLLIYGLLAWKAW
jgi:hypothetical protein